MTRAAKIRLLTIAVIGTAVIVVMGVSGRSRGVNYYFPVWISPSFKMSDFNDRSAELTNIRESLPIVFAAIERSPSALGERWQSLRGRLPGYAQQRLPQYQQWASRPAMQWLTDRSADIEVAQAVVRRWTVWPVHLKQIWFNSITVKNITKRSEYWPMLRATTQANRELRMFAAFYLAAYRPIVPENAESIAQVISSCLANDHFDPMEDWLIMELATHSQVPPRIIEALEQWNGSTNQLRACLAGLALVRLEPSRFPAEQTLEPSIRALLEQPGNSTGRLRSWLELKEFQDISASSWGVDFWDRYLNEASRIPRARWESRPALLFALSIIGTLGPNAARSAPAVIPLMAHHESTVAAAAARTFASIAPPSMELAAAIIPHLTNRCAVAPLLLWLTAIGTNALPAKTTVESIASGTTRYPRSMWSQRPELSGKLVTHSSVRPGGALTSSHESNPRESLSLADEIVVDPRDGCPPRLALLWPGLEVKTTLRYSSMRTSGDFLQGLLIRQPATSLADLARRCLTNMNQPPMRHPTL